MSFLFPSGSLRGQRSGQYVSAGLGTGEMSSLTSGTGLDKAQSQLGLKMPQTGTSPYLDFSLFGTPNRDRLMIDKSLRLANMLLSSERDTVPKLLCCMCVCFRSDFHTEPGGSANGVRFGSVGQPFSGCCIEGVKDGFKGWKKRHKRREETTSQKVCKIAGRRWR